MSLWDWTIQGGAKGGANYPISDLWRGRQPEPEKTRFSKGLIKARDTFAILGRLDLEGLVINLILALGSLL
jgi:hypothetical protein